MSTGEGRRAAVRRRRLVVLVLGAVLVLAGGALLARALLGGGPKDTLARLVGADALLYAHASTDPEWRAAAGRTSPRRDPPGNRD